MNLKKLLSVLLVLGMLLSPVALMEEQATIGPEETVATDSVSIEAADPQADGTISDDGDAGTDEITIDAVDDVYEEEIAGFEDDLTVDGEDFFVSSEDDDEDQFFEDREYSEEANSIANYNGMALFAAASEGDVAIDETVFPDEGLTWCALMS